MVNLENLKHVLLFAGIILAIEILGNRLSSILPLPDIVIIPLAGFVLVLGIYFHIIKG